jgi:surfeit locus 1 family protein
MLRTALKVRWIVFLILVMGAAAAFAWLGQWQLERAIIASQPVDAASETIIPLVELQVPGIAPSLEASGHMTEVTGALVPDSYTVLTGRLNYDQPGYWLVGRFLTEEGSLPVALGWAQDNATVMAVMDELNAAGQNEPSVITGRFMPTEAPDIPDRNMGPLEENTLSVASLINLWPDFSGPVYEGYLVADVAPAGLDVIESIPPMNEGSVNWLNIFYAVEWVVFAGFAFFIWWRLVKDAYERELEEKAQLEAN